MAPSGGLLRVETLAEALRLQKAAPPENIAMEGALQLLGGRRIATQDEFVAHMSAQPEPEAAFHELRELVAAAAAKRGHTVWLGDVVAPPFPST